MECDPIKFIAGYTFWSKRKDGRGLRRESEGTGKAGAECIKGWG